MLLRSDGAGSYCVLCLEQFAPLHQVVFDEFNEPYHDYCLQLVEIRNDKDTINLTKEDK